MKELTRLGKYKMCSNCLRIYDSQMGEECTCKGEGKDYSFLYLDEKTNMQVDILLQLEKIEDDLQSIS